MEIDEGLQSLEENELGQWEVKVTAVHYRKVYVKIKILLYKSEWKLLIIIFTRLVIYMYVPDSLIYSKPHYYYHLLSCYYHFCFIIEDSGANRKQN